MSFQALSLEIYFLPRPCASPETFIKIFITGLTIRIIIIIDEASKPTLSTWIDRLVEMYWDEMANLQIQLNILSNFLKSKYI